MDYMCHCHLVIADMPYLNITHSEFVWVFECHGHSPSGITRSWDLGQEVEMVPSNCRKGRGQQQVKIVPLLSKTDTFCPALKCSKHAKIHTNYVLSKLKGLILFLESGQWTTSSYFILRKKDSILIQSGTTLSLQLRPGGRELSQWNVMTQVNFQELD